jgi:PAS domain S-box-containing protein
MRWLSPRFRIALAMASAVIVLVSLANMFGLMPDADKESLRARAQLCESIALSSSSFAASGNTELMQSLLDATVQRNKQLLSIGVRNQEGELILSAGPHADHWLALEGGKSTAEQMQVPIYQDGDQKWASLEFRFSSLQNGDLWGVPVSVRVRFMVFLAVACFLVFALILRSVLKHLDPSKAVPKRVRDALNNLAEGLLILDTNDQVLLANAAFASVIGTEPEKLIGLQAKALPWIDSEKGHSNFPWTTALEQRRPISNARLALRGVAGDEHSFTVNCSPLLGTGGSYCGVMVTFDDVTALDQKNVELGKAKQAAEAANEAKTAFLANMSHEIRTPINAIMGFADLLRRGMDEGDERRPEYLDIIYTSGTHLIDLINDILDLSKIEAGKLSVEIIDTDPYQIMNDVVDVLKVRAKQAGIAIDAKVEGLIPQTIQSDPTRLRQILLNLSGNAVKFTKQGGVTLTCRMASGEDVPRLAFSVTDTGIGMTEEQTRRIFKPFEQADSSVTRRFGGTGLGLSISKRLTEALGGQIQVTSSPGHGSTFTVTVETGLLDGVPMLDADAAADLARRKRQSARTADEIRLRPSHILLVDDGQSNRDLIRILLSRAGLQVREAKHGAEALQLAGKEDFDLVLMDMQMPIMDGYEATRQLRSQGFSAPIVAMTANAMQGDEKRCREAGCSHFLTKPVDIDQLFEMLAGTLGECDGQFEMDGSVRQAPKGSDCPTERSVASTRLQPAASVPMITSPFADDPELRPVVEQFVSRLFLRMQDMLADFADRNYESLADHAHWLKGAGGTVGLCAFTEPATRLESHARDHADSAIESSLRELVELAESIRLDQESVDCESSSV